MVTPGAGPSSRGKQRGHLARAGLLPLHARELSRCQSAPSLGARRELRESGASAGKASRAAAAHLCGHGREGRRGPRPSEPAVGTRRPRGGALSAHGPQPGLYTAASTVQTRAASDATSRPRGAGAPTARRSGAPGGGCRPGLRSVPQEALPGLLAGVRALAQSTQARVPSVTRRHCFRRTRREPKQPTERQPECVETTLPCKELHETARSVSEIQKTTRAFLSWMKTKKGNFTILAHDSLGLVMKYSEWVKTMPNI